MESQISADFAADAADPRPIHSQATTAPKKAISGAFKTIPKQAFTTTAEPVAILDAVAVLLPGQLLKIQARVGTGKIATLEKP